MSWNSHLLPKTNWLIRDLIQGHCYFYFFTIAARKKTLCIWASFKKARANWKDQHKQFYLFVLLGAVYFDQCFVLCTTNTSPNLLLQCVCMCCKNDEKLYKKRAFCNIFVLKYCQNVPKNREKKILTSIWSEQHSNAGGNIQQLGIDGKLR